MLGYRLRPFRFIAALALMAGVFMVTYAYTARNTVPASSAGDQSQVTLPFSVHNVDYVTLQGQSSTVVSVTFDLQPPAGCPAPCVPNTVKARFTTGGGFRDCTGGPVSFSCPFNEVVTQQSLLQVIAVQ